VKIVACSDTHTQQDSLVVPDGDVFVFAGDHTGNGEPWETKRFNEWHGTLPHPHKIVIAGNHDRNLEQYPHIKWITNATYLLDSSIVIDGVKFYGSPWTPEFCEWAFMKDLGEPMRMVWKEIPDNTDVLITHGPPHMVFDLCPDGSRAGCDELKERISNLNLKAHIFGHIHMRGYMDGVTNEVTWAPGTGFYNVSVLDHQYRMKYPITKIQI